MKITLIMVATVNGKITQGDDSAIYSWTSKEDQDFFFSFLQKYSLIVMGSGTYEAIRKDIKPQPNRRRIILTSHPERYQSKEIPGEIEFRNNSAQTLVAQLENEGFKELLLVGGGETNKVFFEAGLVDELYLTIEPKIFGSGKPLISSGDFEFNLELISHKQLNKKGTLLLHYKKETS